MKIGIVGAGMIGATLARLLVKAGHGVRLANARGPASIEALASEIGATAVTVAQAVADVAVLIISIPQGAIQTLPEGLLNDVPEDVIVIDTGNYYPGLRDPTIDAIEAGMAESVWVSQRLKRPVVKTFNSIGFTSLAQAGRPSGTAGRIALPVAGDNVAAKMAVIALLDEIGFEGVDAGSLAQSWRHQPGTPSYCTDLDREHLISALALADKARSAARRDRFIVEMREIVRQEGTADLIALARRIYGAP